MKEKDTKKSGPHLEVARPYEEKSLLTELVNPETGLRKTILEHDGQFSRFPGIENPELLMPYCSPLDLLMPCVQYFHAFQPREDGTWRMLWTIHPDGRYFADEDDFGAEDDTEVTLYAILNSEGEFLAPFRIYEIGSVRFYGTDLEEREKAEWRREQAALSEARATGMTDQELLRDRVRRTLLRFAEDSDRWPTEDSFDLLIARGQVHMEVCAYSPGKHSDSRWRFHLSLRDGKYASVERGCLPVCGTKAELVEYMKSEKAIAESLSTLGWLTKR